MQINGSDNLLVDAFVDKALGCTPFQAPDLGDNGTLTTALALNELQAAAHQGGQVALVPPNDPMAMDGAKVSVTKTNLYRAGVNQAPINSAGNLAKTYCKNMVDIQVARLQQDQALDQKVGSPDPGAANTLFTFLAQRLNASVTNLGCDQLLKIKAPATLKLKNGVAVDATFGKAAAGASPSASASAAAGKGKGKGVQVKKETETTPEARPRSTARPTR